jgi:hypothetical protein
MEECNTVIPPSKWEVRDCSDYWSAIDYQRLLYGEISPALTNEDLEDSLGLSDRGMDFILKRLKEKHSHMA